MWVRTPAETQRTVGPLSHYPEGQFCFSDQVSVSLFKLSKMSFPAFLHFLLPSFFFLFSFFLK